MANGRSLNSRVHSATDKETKADRNTLAGMPSPIACRPCSPGPHGRQTISTSSESGGNWQSELLSVPVAGGRSGSYLYLNQSTVKRPRLALPQESLVCLPAIPADRARAYCAYDPLPGVVPNHRLHGITN